MQKSNLHLMLFKCRNFHLYPKISLFVYYNFTCITLKILELNKFTTPNLVLKDEE